MQSRARSWVRAHAQDYILEYFRLLTERRKAQHAAHLDRVTNHAFHYYHAPPHPSEIQAAQAALKRGIDEDWQASVQRYPEVLEYFYSLGMFFISQSSCLYIRTAFSGKYRLKLAPGPFFDRNRY